MTYNDRGLRMQRWRQTGPWDSGALRHSTSELWVMSRLAAERGVDVATRLDGVLAAEVLSDRSSFVSFAQQIQAQRTLDLSGRGADWIAALGTRLHASSYGLAGYALICSESLGAALQLAQRLSPLLNLKHVLTLEVSGETTRLRLQRGYVLESFDALEYDTIELLKWLTLLRDIVGPDLRIRAVRLPRSASAGVAAALRNSSHCAVFPGSEVAEIDLPSELLARPLPQREPLTYQHCTEACEQQLQRIKSFEQVTGRVRARLETSVECMPTIDDVARNLCMSARSLRRHLEAEGTSFQLLAEDIRRGTAERLLASTSMSTEAIAAATGYHDVANFRHAFKRWRSETPRQFREREGALGGRWNHAQSSSPQRWLQHDSRGEQIALTTPV